MTDVARLIGLLDGVTAQPGHSLHDVDSDAETEPAATVCDDAMMSSSLPSVIPETPLSAGSEAPNVGNPLVPPSVQTEGQGAELLTEAAQDGWLPLVAVTAVAFVSRAEAMEDVVVRTMGVNNVREMGGQRQLQCEGLQNGAASCEGEGVMPLRVSVL